MTIKITHPIKLTLICNTEVAAAKNCNGLNTKLFHYWKSMLEMHGHWISEIHGCGCICRCHIYTSCRCECGDQFSLNCGCGCGSGSVQDFGNLPFNIL